MIVYYTPPAVTAVAPITAATVIHRPVEIPAAPIMQVQRVNPAGPVVQTPVKPREMAPVPATATGHGTKKGRPSQSWLQASGFPSGVLATNDQWHPNKWIGGGKAPLYQAVKTITGLPVSLGVGVAGTAQVHWLMQSRLTSLYAVARQAGVIIEIMPHTVRIVSG